MPSKFLGKKYNSTIGWRIAAGYSLLMLFSSVVLMAIAYFFLSSTLVRNDREQVSLEMQSLLARYVDGGWPALEQTVLKNDQFRKNNPFFTRIVDPAGRTVKLFLPQYWTEFDLAALELQPPASDGWTRLRAKSYSYELEILSEEVADGVSLQVGISTEDRQAQLRRLEETLTMAVLPLLLLGLSGGALLANRTLRPLRHLVQTVSAINAGQLEARAPRSFQGDELDNLGRLFNEMLDKIRLLIDGMRNALDAVAHDLRTPMTRFSNRAEAALRQDAGPQACREALQDCVEESEIIIRMLHMLMDISEAETGTLQLNRREVDLSDLAFSVAEMYRFVAEDKSVQVATSISPHVRASLDPERISQALANLLDNAVKFTPPGGRIDLSLSSDSDRLHICVEDSGIGIDTADLERIWERLYRGGQQGSGRGMGLGLSLVRAVIKAHGGEVSAQNRPEGGAVFKISLPTADPTKV